MRTNGESKFSFLLIGLGLGAIGGHQDRLEAGGFRWSQANHSYNVLAFIKPPTSGRLRFRQAHYNMQGPCEVKKPRRQ